MPHRLARLLLLVAISTAGACSSGPPPPDTSNYVEEIARARAEKDTFFRESRDTPIAPAVRDKLLPLPYFPIDPAYSVPAALRLSEERPVFEMPTSTGTIRKYQRVGVLEFTLQGKPLTLGAFVEDGQPIDTLFVPFVDLTSGKDTYPAGRYLDLHQTASQVYTIDFNTAYNPYCAYNSGFECPYPPASNRLTVPIRAGEMSPHR